MADVLELQRKRPSADAIAIPEFSEERLALDFVNANRARIRFVGDLGQWFLWDGARWSPDEKRCIFDWARDICRRAADSALQDKDSEKYARTLASAKTRYAITSLASDDQRVSMLSNEFDCDTRLLGTPGGTVNLTREEK